jgi:hypothetical protein
MKSYRLTKPEEGFYLSDLLDFFTKKTPAMKATFTSLALVLFFFLGKTTACDCLPIGNFCKTITYENNGEIWSHLNIYLVEVTAQQTGGMKVEIAKTYFGENLNGSSIFVNSGNGADCQLFTGQFQAGEKMIIAAGNYSNLWYISECGVSFLKVENGLVKGPIAEGITEIPFEEFHTLSNCGNLQLNPSNEPGAPDFIQVSPTMAFDNVWLKSSGALSSTLTLRVFDVAGRQVFQSVVPAKSGPFQENIPVGKWAPGVYFFNLNLAGKQHTVKVVKMNG